MEIMTIENEPFIIGINKNHIYKKGDTVTITGDSGFCCTETVVIRKTQTRYDSKTGQPYQIYTTDTGQKFDGRDGWAITPPMAYYIKGVAK